jgi:hypothetical protein
MENFINAIPGLRAGCAPRLRTCWGPENGKFFFDRMLDYFLAKEDIRSMKTAGATVVRLPLNYRHFERDDAQFQYLEKGFARLDQIVQACAKYGLYGDPRPARRPGLAEPRLALR